MSDIKHFAKYYMREAIACTALIVLAAALIGAAEKPAYTKEELARLEAGEVVISHIETKISDTEEKSMLVSSVYIHQPAEIIWEVVDHPEREKDWIPYVKLSNVSKDARPTPTTRICTIDYVLSGFGIDVYYSLVREYDYKAKTIRGYLDKTRPHKYFLEVSQGWNFVPYKNAIIFRYWSDSKLTLTLPKVVSRSFSEKQISGGAEAIRNRCNFVAQEKKKP